MVDYAKLAGALGASGGGGGGGDLSQLLKALRARQQGGRGGSDLSSLAQRFRQFDSNLNIAPPKEAPGTKNLGESLLNLLALGSAPMASQGQAAAEELARFGRILGNKSTGEDQEFMRDATRKIREGGPLGLLQVIGESGARIGGRSIEGVGETLDAINPWGSTPSSKIPTWANNLRTIQEAGVNAGIIDEPNNDPGWFFGVGNNDGALAGAGLALDIALDPVTYLTLGIGGAVKGALRGASRAAGRAIGDGADAPLQALRYAGKDDLGFELRTPLGVAPTASHRLAEAAGGAARGFKDEAGRFWMADFADAMKARRAAKAAGRTNATEGIRAANAGGAAARAVDDAAETSAVIDDLLTPASRAAAEAGSDILARGGDDGLAAAAKAAAGDAASLAPTAAKVARDVAEGAPEAIQGVTRIDEGSNLALISADPRAGGLTAIPDRSFDDLVARWASPTLMNDRQRRSALDAIGHPDLPVEGVTPEQYAGLYRDYASRAIPVGTWAPNGGVDELFARSDPRTVRRGQIGGSDLTRALDRVDSDWLNAESTAPGRTPEVRNDYLDSRGYSNNNIAMSSLRARGFESREEVAAADARALLGREPTEQEARDLFLLGQWVAGLGISGTRYGVGDNPLWHEMMEAASRLIKESPEIDLPLYRGMMRTDTDRHGLNLFRAEPGDEFTLAPTSWTVQPHVAKVFAREEASGSVILVLAGQKQALPMRAIGGMGEYLAEGKFRIVDRTMRDVGGNGRQIPVLTIEKVTPDMPGGTSSLIDDAADTAGNGGRVAASTADPLANDLLGDVSRETVRSVQASAATAWGTTLAKSVNSYARGTQEALRKVVPFEAKPQVTPLSSVGAAGERDVMGGIVSFWRQIKSGRPLSKPRAAMKPQMDEVASTRIRRDKLAETHPNLAAVIEHYAPAEKRAASGKLRTTIDAGRILDLLASGKLAQAVRTLEKAGTPKFKPGDDSLARRISELTGGRREGNLELLRAADAEAREVVGAIVDRVSAKHMKGASPISTAAQRVEWAENLTKVLARTARGVESDGAWAAKTADELSRITDPAELGARLEAIASSMHQVAHKGPKDFFGYIERTPARKVLEQVDAQGLRDFAASLGLPTKGNAVTVLKGLREGGRVAYDEAIKAERAAARAFGSEYDVAGGRMIDDAVRAIGDDVQPLKAAAMRDAEAAVARVDPDDVEGAVIAPLNSALRRNLAGEKKKRWLTKAGELASKGNVFDADGRMVEKVLVERFEDFSGMMGFAGAARHFSKKADELGYTGAQRAAYMDEKVMNALAAQDAYLRARGIPPTSRMSNAEKVFRLGGKQGLKHRNEVAFLSLRDVLEEIPAETRQLLLFGGGRASIPPTLLHMMGRWAIRRFEAPTAELAEKVAAHRNAFIQHEWARMGGKVAFSDSNRFGALADQILSDPDIVARLSEKHVRNAVAARAIWADSAASATLGVRDAFRKALASPHATTGAKIEQLLGLSEKIAKAVGQAGIEDDIVKSMAQLDASVLAGELVGPDLWYMARRSGQVREVEKFTDAGVAMTDAEFIALREGLGDAEVAANIERARRGEEGAFKALKDTPRIRRAREAEATASAQILRDAEPDIRAVTDDKLRAMQEAGQEVGALDAAAVRYDTQFQFGFENRFLQGAFTKFKRGFGAERSDALRVQAQFSPVQMTARFGRGLAQVAQKYGSTTAPALVSGFKLLQRLSADPEGFRVMSEYMDAVRGAVTAGAAREGVEEAREALMGTLARVGAENAGDEVLEAAMDLWPAVATVFDPSAHGLFARAGNDANALNAILKTFQATDPEGKPLAMYGGFSFTQNGAAGDLGPAWRSIGAGGQDIDPIEILRSTHAALQHATVAPTVAASFSTEFGHAAFGLTREEALSRGWQRPYKPSDTRRPFVQYLDPTQLYAPEMLSELKYLDDLLQGVQKPGPFLSKLFEITDPIVQAVKSSITIWRPGHWMTNIMGEAWMNTFAGVTNPMRYSDAMRMMVHNHRMVKPDYSFFDDYLARNVTEGRAPRPIDADTRTVDLNIGGSLQAFPDDLIYRGFEQRGIVLSHIQADDIAFDAERQALTVGQRKPFQTIRDINTALGRGSVARDSIFRVAHALDVLQKGKFRSLDDALDAAARQVHKWHPSYQTLSPFDQVYTRRTLYFYTWMRQAMSRMIEMSLNTPALAVLPSRVMYAISYANGLDPQSVGNPVSQGLDLPDYLNESLTGSGIQVGGRVYGFSMNAPTTDIFSQLIGPISWDPTISAPDNVSNAFGSFVGSNFGGMITPALTVPFSVATDRTVRGQQYEPQEGFAGRLQNLVDQTGAAYPSKITGQLLPGLDRTDHRTEPEDQAERQWLTLINALTGMKFAAQSSQNVANSAEREERDRFARWLEMQSSPNTGQ